MLSRPVRLGERSARERTVWLAGIGIVAASVADPLVESLANAGCFGPAFTDHDQRGVLPALLTGIALLLCFAVLRAHATWRRPESGTRDRFLELARSFERGSWGNDLPVVAAAQAFALYAIESGETLLASGHVAHGLAWLGAPPLVAALVHAGIGIASFFGVGAVMRAIGHGVAAFLAAALRTYWLALARQRPSSARSRAPRPPIVRDLIRHPRVALGRAPPRLSHTPA